MAARLLQVGSLFQAHAVAKTDEPGHLNPTTAGKVHMENEVRLRRFRRKEHQRKSREPNQPSAAEHGPFPTKGLCVYIYTYYIFIYNRAGLTQDFGSW
jgi:arginine/lysine/ornithine decarboxylase